LEGVAMTEVVAETGVKEGVGMREKEAEANWGLGEVERMAEAEMLGSSQ
jgi:FlaA1/EpsC-like NDP-sugar epimerase